MLFSNFSLKIRTLRITIILFIDLRNQAYKVINIFYKVLIIFSKYTSFENNVKAILEIVSYFHIFLI